VKLYLEYRFARVRNWRWRRWVRHWTWPKAIFFLLTIGPVSVGLAHWGISQTFSNMKIDFVCGQIDSIQHASYNRSDQSGHVTVMIGFNNPGIPFSLDWTITAQTNITAGVIPGYLSSTIPNGKSVENMSFYVQAWNGNGTITQIFSFTKYQALGNALSDPRIFSQSYDPSSPIRDYRKVNDTAIQVPVFVAYLFYTQTGYYPRFVGSTGTFNPSCKTTLAAYGFSS
jgi:hypothetical protein